MKRANALEVRQNLGGIIKRLNSSGEPILIEKGRRPAAVLITLEDYQRRFADLDADAKRREIVEEILKEKHPLPAGRSSIDLIHEIRE